MNPFSRLKLVSRVGFTFTSALFAVPLGALALGGVALTGCSSPSSASSPSSGDVHIESAVLGTPSTVTAAADGGCSAVSSVASGSAGGSGTDIATLCGPGEIPIPVAADSNGCSDGTVASITFGCVTATVPTPPDPGTCAPIPIEDPESLLPATVTSALPAIPAAVCPGLGLVPPPATNDSAGSTTASSAGGSANIPAPALPTTWPSVPAPGAPSNGSASIAPTVDAGTLPGGSIGPGAPPVVTCCSPVTPPMPAPTTTSTPAPAPVPTPTPTPAADAGVPPLPSNG